MTYIRYFRKSIRLLREKYIKLQLVFYFGNKKRIFIYDQVFAHSFYSNPFLKSKYIHWDRIFDVHKIKVFTDKSLKRSLSVKGNKIAWLLESPAIIPESITWVKSNYKQFQYVFTHNRKLLELDKRFFFVPAGGTWIKKKDWGVMPKIKLVSMVASGKNKTTGHKMRHEIIKRRGVDMDVFGREYNPVRFKVSALKNYMFSFSIENISEDYYFTEKIIDCFLTGTIPIYYGCPSIGDFFNEKGIIKLNSIDDLEMIMNTISTELYYEKLQYVRENYILAQKYFLAEDYMFSTYRTIFENT